jgi:hypothetical protein
VQRLLVVVERRASPPGGSGETPVAPLAKSEGADYFSLALF